MPADFPAIYSRLRAVLQKNIGRLTVKHDTPAHYCLQGGLHPKHKTPMDIAWVKIDKNYVSFHLMPIYGCPQLLDDCQQRRLQASKSSRGNRSAGCRRGRRNRTRTRSGPSPPSRSRRSPG